MSSLWTPRGEVPVDRSRGASNPPPEAEPTSADRLAGEADMAAQADELARFLLEAPAGEIVAQHAMGLYELAVIHLSQPEPRLADARLAIDALAALVDGLAGRLGEMGAQLRQALPQLQMAYVQLADRSPANDTSTERGDG